MLKRFINLAKLDGCTFFLWGPRQIGKSTLLRNTFSETPIFNLLNSDTYQRLLTRPSLLREEVLALFADKSKKTPKFIIIDEIQKLPQLTDEVHLLIEEHQINFCLCGSSARKLRKVHANMLGGRAIRRELFGLVYPEIEQDFDLTRILNRGILPSHYLNENYSEYLSSYLGDYLKEEIAAEGLVRNLPSFAQFLQAASFSDSEILVYKNVASDCGVSLNTVRSYFEILQDTLIGRFVHAYTKKAKRKVIHAPKFYYFNVALVNILTKRGHVIPGSLGFGKAFENWIFHEVNSFIHYKNKNVEVTYWHLADSGAEVDFIIGDFDVAIEVKSSSNIDNRDLKGLRELEKEHPKKVRRKIVVSCETNARLTDDQIHIIPVKEFLIMLWGNEIF